MNPFSEGRGRLLPVVLSLALLAGAFPRIAFAEPSAADLSSARELMKEGRALRAKNDHAGALGKFKAAYAAVPTPITGLAVAEEQAALGKWVEAHETLVTIGKMPPAPNESDVGRQARTDAASLLAELVARIPILEITITGAPAGQIVTLKVDGASVEPSSAEQGWRVNPGKHIVVASTAGKPDQSRTVEVQARERRKFEMPFPEGAASAPTAPPAAPLRPALDPPTNAAPARSPVGTIGLVAAAAGVVIVGVGGVIALAAKGAHSDAKDAHCGTGICDADGKQATEDAIDRAGTATVLIGVGAVVAVTGVVLWATAPSAGRDAKSTATRLHVGLGAITFGGTF